MDAIGVAVLIGTLALATVAGFMVRARSGRLRTGGSATDGWRLAGDGPRDRDRVLLLQISSPVCTPCRQTSALLSDLARRHAGVVHREVDVAEQPDVARELGVMRTPTVVAFDRSGGELLRVTGVPRPAELEARIAPQLASARPDT